MTCPDSGGEGSGRDRPSEDAGGGLDRGPRPADRRRYRTDGGTGDAGEAGQQQVADDEPESTADAEPVGQGPSRGLAYQAALGLTTLFYVHLLLLALGRGIPILFLAFWVLPVVPMVADLMGFEADFGGSPVAAWALMGLLLSPLIVPYYVYKRGKLLTPKPDYESATSAYFYALLVVGSLSALSYLLFFGQILLFSAGVVGSVFVVPGQVLMTIFGLVLAVGLIIIDVTDLGGTLAGSQEYVWAALALSPPFIWLPVYFVERSRV